MPIDLDKVSVFCFLASYVVAFGLEWTRLMRRTAIGRWVGFGFGVAGFVAQTAYLLGRSRGHENLPPLLSSTHDWLLVLAWVVVFLYLFLTSIDRELAVGLFLLPVVLLFVGASYFVSKKTNALIEGSRGLAMLHATLLVIGIAGVVASFVLSLMYLVQHRRLKQHHAQQPGVLLPSLARLARWNWWGVVISVPLLTLGLGSGVALGLTSKKAAATLSFTDPIVIGYGIVWLVMMSLFMWLLTTRRSTGKQVAALTLWAGGFLLVMLIGLLVLTGEGLSSFHGGAKSAQRNPTLERGKLILLRAFVAEPARVQTSHVGVLANSATCCAVVLTRSASFEVALLDTEHTDDTENDGVCSRSRETSDVAPSTSEISRFRRHSQRHRSKCATSKLTLRVTETATTAEVPS